MSASNPSCPEARLLGPLAANVMTGVDGGVAAHVATCLACQARVGRLRALFTPPRVEPPPALFERIRQRIDEQTARETGPRVTGQGGAPGVWRGPGQDPSRDEELGAPRPERWEHMEATRAGHPMVGRRIGDYVVTGVLGEGGMGIVYRGEHATLGQPVAIKSMHSTLVNNASAKERFAREAQALARLQHPNIVSLLSYVDGEDGCAIVLELAEGEDVERKIQEAGLLPAERCLPWFIDVCRGLEYAHRRGIVHRDLKPSNIVVHPSGTAKLLDFGTAKLVDAKRLTQQGMTLGTIIYMSKEQLLGKPVDARSDVYSLGVTLYECLTGKLPFYDEEERKLVVKIARSEPIPPRQHYPGISPELERVVLKAMAKEPEARYQSAAELEGALLALASQGAVAATAAGPTALAPALAPVAPRAAATTGVELSRVLLVGLVLLVLGLGAGTPLVVLGAGVTQAAGVALLALGLLGATLLVAGAVQPRPEPSGPTDGQPQRPRCPSCGRALLAAAATCPFCSPPAA